MPASIELISQNVDRPLLHARCEPSCGNFFSAVWDANHTPGDNVAAFITAANSQGWAISLLGNMCPVHLAKAREQEARIVMPGGKLIN